jgi:hypothetical protein
MALSYGLIRVPQKAWQNRNLSLMLGFLYFKIKKLQDKRKDSMYELETQYAVLGNKADPPAPQKKS